MRSFGINVEDGVAERVEQRRIVQTDAGQEIASRSEVCNHLLRLGLTAAETIDESALDVPDGRPREAMVRQALLDQVVAELDGDADGE